MKRWGIQTNGQAPKSHVILGVFALVGFALILVSLAGPVFSATPVPVGHDPSQIGSGTFGGTNPSVDRWTFPGAVEASTVTANSSLQVGTGTIWDFFTSVSTTPYLGLRALPAGASLFFFDSTGKLGVGIIPTQALDVLGIAHASTDVCYGDSSDGKCLSDLKGVPRVSTVDKLQVVCNPTCDYSTSFNLDTAAFDPDGDNEGTITASCPTGTIPLSCGGGVKVENAGEFLKAYSIVPQYNSVIATPGDTGIGCKMEWKTTTGNLTIRGFVRAACVSLYP